jgi:putative redox protein
MTGTSWIFVKASWKGGTKFVIENRAGCRETITARVPAGETSRYFSPVDAFIASLAACAGTNVVLILLDQGVTVKSFTVKAECILKDTEPRSFEKIHLHFLLGGEMDDGIVMEAITRSMTLVCPIAVTIGRAAEVTWEQHITRKAAGK